MPLILSLKKAAAAGISLRFIQVPLGEGLPLALRCWMLTADADGILGLSSVYSQGCMADEAAGTLLALKSSKAPTNYFTPNILRKSWSRLVVSVVHLDALAFPVAAT